ncbi:ABC transporter permease [Derxia gummosa]|uniref:ABC transporter permease n=1 Tax=Derxia gummosa DSM 723 TaxID=1121388 RepID=A0A8B6X8R7_9BURK|nr:FtsX-like permease family protein [Derxia gummosa]
MFFIKVGWRNILRHRRRSLVTLLAIVTGLVGIIAFGGFVQANYEGLRESVIRSQYGHLQLFRAGYEANHRQQPERYRLSPEDAGRIETLLAQAPHFAVAARRLEFTALLGSDKLSEAAIVRGVDPDNEGLINSALAIIDGNDLDSSEEDGVLLGEGLAQALGVKVGDTLTLMGTTAGGMMNALDVRVAGVFRSFAKEYDDRAAMVGLPLAQRLLSTGDVDNVVLLIDDTTKLDETVAWLTPRLEAAGLKVETKSWFELATFYRKVVDLYDGFFAFVVAVIALVVLFSIANTMMIAVMERTAEIGTLRALGTRREGVVKQFVVEALLLGLIGSAVGVVVAVGVSEVVSGLQIMMPPPPGSSRGYPLRIAQVPPLWALAACGVLVIAFFATLFPAMGAARRPVVDALRHV